jgi:hypothetical protein
MIDFIYIKNSTPDMRVYNTYNELSLLSFKKVIDSLCNSGLIYKYKIAIKTKLVMQKIVNVLSYSSKQYRVREHVIIHILDS